MTHVIEYHLQMEKLMARNNDLLMPSHLTKAELQELWRNSCHLAWLSTKLMTFARNNGALK